MTLDSIRNSCDVFMSVYHSQLFNSTVCCCRVGRDPVEKEGSSPSLEQKGAPGEEMMDCLGFLLSRVASKSRGNFFQLLNCDRVETAQGFDNNWYKSQTLFNPCCSMSQVHRK